MRVSINWLVALVILGGTAFWFQLDSSQESHQNPLVCQAEWWTDGELGEVVSTDTYWSDDWDTMVSRVDGTNRSVVMDESGDLLEVQF